MSTIKQTEVNRLNSNDRKLKRMLRWYVKK